MPPSSTSRQDPAVAPCPLQAGKGQVEVVVVDDRETPLSGVAVELAQGAADEALRTRTDEHGVALFEGLVEGRYRFRLLDVEPALWRVLGRLPLPPRAAGAAPRWSSVSLPKPLSWTCEGTESLAVLAAKLGVRPSRLIDASTGQPLTPEVAPAPGTRVEVLPFSHEWTTVETGFRHVVHRIGLPLSLVVVLRDGTHHPRAHQPYLLKVWLDDEEELPAREGMTDAEGRMAQVLPARAARGEVTVSPGRDDERKVTLRFAALRATSAPEGLQERLENLGFSCGGERGQFGPKTRLAVEWFQYALGLPPSGEADEATCAALGLLHRS
ncbi:peptidoglycan-binding protein [Myxococcus sp. AB056]|uniref:peptidoglycan-binding domain-containing protein n=1 Tax=Myxococcus sp. AB056 TaxID=2562792 RepID=UPI001E3AF846|nr:peptidoglycan-binding protein [Myxococcus sp. AB056]